MLKNYIKTAIRNLRKNKAYSIINILGLALGMSVFFLIIQYISFEKSYDRFYKHAEQIYRVRNDRIYSDKHDKSAGCPPAVAPALKKEFPEVLESARLRGTGVMFLDMDKKIAENLDKVYFADASFLNIFSLPMTAGSAETALEEPYSVMISQTLSQKYFKDENPINKMITLVNDNGNKNYTITGVFRDIPQNSHLKLNMLISYKTLIIQNSQAEFYWGWNAFNTYVLLAPHSDPKALEAKFPAMVEKYKNYENSYRREYLLQPVKDIHLHSNLRFEPEVNGDAATVNFLSIIAIFILILAWINYINLSTCRSLSRAKEVGVRKVLGTNRFQLIKQFMIESLMLNSLALALALAMVQMILPAFNSLTGKPLSINLLSENWELLAATLAAGAFLSGIYPAFVLSSFNPIVVLKKKFGRTSSGIDLRKGLVIFQFAISIILITSTLVVYQQLSYMRSKDLGINIDQVLTIKAPKLQNNFIPGCISFKDALLAFPTIRNVAASATIPGKDYSNASSGVRRQSSQPEDGTQGFFVDVDENFFNLFDVPVLAGKNFSRESRLNREIILNEEAVKVYGFKSPDEAINQKMVFDGFDGQSIEIIGVVRDYHQKSLKSSLQPVIFNPIYATDVNLTRYFSIRIAGDNVQQTMNQIKNKWNEFYPNQPFEYDFLNQVFDSQYKADVQFGKVFGLFTFLAILISCLGLFALASYTNLQRTKEIGIRKVVGASIKNIMVMLVKDFTKWVLIANLIAWPVAWLAMNRWLQDFSYRINMSWWMFVLSGILALAIALLTVSWQAIRSATANPVEALRFE